MCVLSSYVHGQIGGVGWAWHGMQMDHLQTRVQLNPSRRSICIT